MKKDFEKVNKFLYKYKDSEKTIEEWISYFKSNISPRRVYRRLNNKNWFFFEKAFDKSYLRGYARDYVGKTVHGIKILKIIGKNNSDLVVSCKCHCGTFFKNDWSPLFRNVIKSCGCLNHVSGLKNKKRTGYYEISGSLISSLKNGAKVRNIDYNISNKYLWDLFLLQNKKCALSKIDLNFKIHSKDERTASLDRIDSSKGYIEGNVQWVHKDINTMKWDLNQKDFIKYCHLISKNNL